VIMMMQHGYYTCYTGATYNSQKSWSLKQTWVGWHRCLGTGLPHRRFLRIYSVCKKRITYFFTRATLIVNKSHSLTVPVYNLSYRQRYSVNSDRVQILLCHCLAYYTSPGRKTMSVEQSVELVTGETEGLEENLPKCRFAHHKSHMTWPRLEPGPPRWEASD
jgi:hypothetical protein